MLLQAEKYQNLVYIILCSQSNTLLLTDRGSLQQNHISMNIMN